MNALESSTYILLGIFGLLWLLLPLISKTFKQRLNTFPRISLWDRLTALLFAGVGIICTIRLFTVFKTQEFNMDPSLDPRFLGLLLLLLALLFFSRAGARRRAD